MLSNDLSERPKLQINSENSTSTCYSDQSYENVGDTEVIGWGSRLSVGIGLVPILRKTTVVPVSNQVCSGAMGAGRISKQMICAGAEGTDTCQVLRL